MDSNDKKLPENEKGGNDELTSLISNAIENKKILEQSEQNGANQVLSQPMKAPAQRPDPQRQHRTANNAQRGNRNGQRPRPQNTQRPVQGSHKPAPQGQRAAQNGQNAKAENPQKPHTNNEGAKVQNNTKPAQEKAVPQTHKAVQKNDTTEKDKNSKGKKKWSVKKKTGVTLGIIFLVFILILALIVGIFRHYTGLLDRNGDTTINSGKAPLDSSLFVDESNTVDEAELEAQLKAQLASQSTKISDENVMNILLIGEDIRDTEGNDRGNTDVMMLISINHENKTITMTSLMRDMYVYMSEYSESNRLNSAFWHGGCEYLESVVEDYFGVEIDRYVKVNFYQFIDVVEAIGGIDMNIRPEEASGMNDPLAEQNKYIGNKKGTDYITLDKEETLHLNGNQALAFARLRYVGNADFERTERQRRVISEVIKEAKNLSFLKFDSLVNKVFPHVQTDITDGEIASLLLDAFDLMDYSIQELRIPTDGYYTNEIINNMAVLVPDFTANAVILQKMVYGTCTSVDEAMTEYQDDLNNGVYFNADGTVYSENANDTYNQNGYDNYNYGY